MADSTKIAWTDSTVNFWWGCTKVGPGCEFCYAEQWDKRTGGAHWGVGVERRKIASAINTMYRLDKRAVGTHRVFVQSMSDLFDMEVPLEWFAEGWRTICACDRLAIQIVTKRASVIEKRLAAIRGTWPRHAGLIVTVVDQDEADRDVPRARALKARLGIPWLGLSIEPQIGPIRIPSSPTTGFTSPFGVDWVISGGESKQGKDHLPRHYDLAWARSLRDQCAANGVAYFQKQLGSNPTWFDPTALDYSTYSGIASNGRQVSVALKDRAGADPAEWPADLRVQEFPQ